MGLETADSSLTAVSDLEHQSSSRECESQRRRELFQEPSDLTMPNLPPLPENYAKGFELIDEAHALDPRPSDHDSTPFELRYAEKMTKWLAERCPSASPALQLACRAQHFRR